MVWGPADCTSGFWQYDYAVGPADNSSRGMMLACTQVHIHDIHPPGFDLPTLGGLIRCVCSEFGSPSFRFFQSLAYLAYLAYMAVPLLSVWSHTQGWSGGRFAKWAFAFIQPHMQRACCLLGGLVWMARHAEQHRVSVWGGHASILACAAAPLPLSLNCKPQPALFLLPRLCAAALLYSTPAAGSSQCTTTTILAQPTEQYVSLTNVDQPARGAGMALVMAPIHIHCHYTACAAHAARAPGGPLVGLRVLNACLIQGVQLMMPASHLTLPSSPHNCASTAIRLQATQWHHYLSIDQNPPLTRAELVPFLS